MHGPEREAIQRDGEVMITRLSGGANDENGDEHAFVEISTPRDTYFVQERIELRVRLGVETRFLQTSLVQLFPQRLDVPVQLSAPWIQDLPDLRGAIALPDEVEKPVGGARRSSFALDERVVEAARVQDRLVDGRSFTVLEIEKSFLPTSAGELTFEGPLLRFAYAIRFDEGSLNGRVALDRRDAVVHGESLKLRIEPLPEAGRPIEFTGAVGSFTVQAQADRYVLTVGESFVLTLRIEGDGNLESFEAPRLSELAGFHVEGTLDAKGPTLRTLTYHLAPLREDVKEVPPIAFAYFDPHAPAGYRSVRTQAIPITVRPAPVAAREERLQGGEKARATPSEPDVGKRIPYGPPGSEIAVARSLLVLALLVLGITALALALWLRTRARKHSDPDRDRARER